VEDQQSLIEADPVLELIDPVFLRVPFKPNHHTDCIDAKATSSTEGVVLLRPSRSIGCDLLMNNPPKPSCYLLCMGVFGTGIFGDDLSCDVRDSYTDLIGDGVESSRASTLLLKRYAVEQSDPQDGPPFWLSLALTQWKLGRLEQEVLARAIEVIESGSDLARWDAGTLDYKKRQAVLDNTLKTLLSPQRPPRKVPKRHVDENDWEIGDLFSYTLPSGKKIIFRVIGHVIDRGGKYPSLEMLSWIGTEIPSRLTLRFTGIWKNSRPNYPISQLLMLGAKDIPIERLQKLSFSLKPVQREAGGVGWFWKDLDKNLKKDFDIE
jgi:hypothetical protein